MTGVVNLKNRGDNTWVMTLENGGDDTGIGRPLDDVINIFTLDLR